MSLDSARLSVRRAASLGHRARRSYAARRLVVRLLPWAAAVSCSASALALLLGRARPLGLFLLVASAVAAAIVLIAARVDRPTPDDVVAALDKAAALDGALRSAHWFSSDTSGDAESGVTAGLMAFHLETAALRAEGVDWASVYARPPAARAWVTTALLGIAAVLMLAWESPRLPLPFGSGTQEPASGAVTVIPSHLVGEVIEGMKILQAGDQPSRETLTAVGKALETAKNDVAARRQLEKLFAQSGQDQNYVEPFFDDATWDEETLAPQWAYEEAVARASVQQSPEAAVEKAAPQASEASGDARGEMDRGVTGSKSDSAPVHADTRGRAGSFSSLLLGTQQAKGDAETSSLRGTSTSTASNAALMAALRREVVRARDDVDDANRRSVARRTTSDDAVAMSPAVEPPIARRYDASKAARPPAVPAARRPLLHDFFARVVDDTPVVKDLNEP